MLKVSQILLTLGLALPLAGCAGYWRTQYPKATLQTCFKDQTIQSDEQDGIIRAEIKSPVFSIMACPSGGNSCAAVNRQQQLTSVLEQQLKAGRQAAKLGNYGPLNAAYAKVRPIELANFMIACNNLAAKDVNNGIVKITSGYTQLIQLANQFLNETPAPYPTPRTCSNNYMYNHPEIIKAGAEAGVVYSMTPLVNANTNDELQAIKPLQQLHQTTENIAPQKVALVSLGFLRYNSSSYNQNPALSGLTNFYNANVEAQNGNYADLIAISEQIQQKKWRHYFVSCERSAQKRPFIMALVNASVPQVNASISQVNTSASQVNASLLSHQLSQLRF